MERFHLCSHRAVQGLPITFYVLVYLSQIPYIHLTHKSGILKSHPLSHWQILGPKTSEEV